MPDPDFSFMWMRIYVRIRLFTLMRIQILASKIKAPNPWKSAQIGPYSIHFGLSSANAKMMRILFQIQLNMWIRILIFSWCGSGFLFDADPEPGFQNDAEPQLAQHWSRETGCRQHSQRGEPEIIQKIIWNENWRKENN
jgi:hypothetical protein